jgi:microcystin-dependent protein
MGAGDQAGNWGNTTNTNLGSLIEQAITGVGNITMLNATTTLVAGAGIVDQARNAVLVLGGSLTANRDLIVPSFNKFYAVRNATSGGFSIVVKTSGGSGVTLANGLTQLMYCDGTNVVLASPPMNAANGDLEVAGNIFSGGSPVMPTGSIIEYGGATAPTGWLLCDGASLLRASYPALFAVIGTAYGSVDINTFNVPDRRDRVGVGAGSTYLRGATGGATTSTTSADGAHDHTGSTDGHALTTAQMPSHTHGVTDPGHSHVVSPALFKFGGSFDVQGGFGTSTDAFTATANTSITGISINSEGGGQVHSHGIQTQAAHTHTTSTLQPYVASNFIIKA